MLQDKRTDLDAEKRRKLLDRMVAEVSRANPDLYYRSTSEVAVEIRRHIAEDAALNSAERELLEGLSAEDIQMILSLH